MRTITPEEVRERKGKGEKLNLRFLRKKNGSGTSVMRDGSGIRDFRSLFPADAFPANHSV